MFVINYLILIGKLDCPKHIKTPYFSKNLEVIGYLNA